MFTLYRKICFPPYCYKTNLKTVKLCSLLPYIKKIRSPPFLLTVASYTALETVTLLKEYQEYVVSVYVKMRLSSLLFYHHTYIIKSCTEFRLISFLILTLYSRLASVGILGKEREAGVGKLGCHGNFDTDLKGVISFKIPWAGNSEIFHAFLFFVLVLHRLNIYVMYV